MDFAGLVDRFWLWSLGEPWVLGAFLVGLFGLTLLGWWIGWKGGNHLVGAAIAAGCAWLWRGVYERIRRANTRPKAS